jgi:hypothetical protein
LGRIRELNRHIREGLCQITRSGDQGKVVGAGLALKTVGSAGCDTVLARRIVLATGQDGGGAWTVAESNLWIRGPALSI